MKIPSINIPQAINTAKTAAKNTGRGLMIGGATIGLPAAVAHSTPIHLTTETAHELFMPEAAKNLVNQFEGYVYPKGVYSIENLSGNYQPTKPPVQLTRTPLAPQYDKNPHAITTDKANFTLEETQSCNAMNDCATAVMKVPDFKKRIIDVDMSCSKGGCPPVAEVPPGVDTPGSPWGPDFPSSGHPDFPYNPGEPPIYVGPPDNPFNPPIDPPPFNPPPSTPVPEPGTLTLFGTGLAALARFMRKITKTA